MIPHTSSGSAPPTSLNRALQTASDLTAQCPRWAVSGLARVWELQNLGGQSLLSSNPHKLGTSLSPWCVVRGAYRQQERGEKVCLRSLRECEQLLESESTEQIRGPLVVKRYPVRGSLKQILRRGFKCRRLIKKVLPGKTTMKMEDVGQGRGRS